MPWFKLKKKKSRQPSPQPVPPRIPSHVDTPPPDIGRKSSPVDTVSKGKLRLVGVEIDEFVLTVSPTDVNDPGDSQIALSRDDHGDDVTRGYADGKADDDGHLERGDEQRTPSVPDHKHFLADIPSEREPGTPDLHGHGPVVERPTETPLALAVFGGHGGGDAPDLVQSERSEREWW